MKALAQACSGCTVRFWTAALGLMLVSSTGTVAAESSPSPAPPSGTQSVRLDYQEVAFAFLNRSLRIEPRSSSFEQEPAGLPRGVVRGFLQWGGNDSDSMAFLWDKSDGRLYLDLNRNQDLTDDPDGNYMRRDGDTDRFQLFPDVHVRMARSGGTGEALVDLSFYSYGSRNYCTCGVRSLWAGQVTLNGEDWQVGIIISPFGASASEGDTLLLRPWAEREESFSLLSTLPETFECPDKLFLGGKAYKVDRSSILEDGRAKVDVQFREQPSTLGDLEIRGQFIDRLSLSGDEYLVLLDHPGNKVKVPVGHYSVNKIRLLAGNTEASRTTASLRGEQPFSVAPDDSAVLVTGGPLTNSVRVQRRGRHLSFSYQLVGADGKAYQLEGQDQRHPPEFAVYHDDKRIASGKFEYG